jgi:hypothetical protein
MVDRLLGPTTRLLLPYAERFTDELVAHARRSTPVANIFDTPPLCASRASRSIDWCLTPMRAFSDVR